MPTSIAIPIYLLGNNLYFDLLKISADEKKLFDTIFDINVIYYEQPLALQPKRRKNNIFADVGF